MREQVRAILRRQSSSRSPPSSTPRRADAALRAEVLVALALGVSLTRARGTLPALAEAPPDEVLAVLDPLVGALVEKTH